MYSPISLMWAIFTFSISWPDNRDQQPLSCSQGSLAPLCCLIDRKITWKYSFLWFLVSPDCPPSWKHGNPCAHPDTAGCWFCLLGVAFTLKNSALSVLFAFSSHRDPVGIFLLPCFHSTAFVLHCDSSPKCASQAHWR